MIYTCKPTKVEIYDNRATRYTAAKVKAITGADIVFNGGLFDMKTYAPYCALKINGVVKVNESWVRNGFGWNNGEMPKLMSVAELPNVDNFIACITAVENGAKVNMSYPADMGGRRGRTAFGMKPDGSMVIACTCDGNPAITMEQTQDKLLAQGCVSGIILDGGGSSQIISPVETIASTRIVSNFICIWLNGGTDKKEDDNSTTGDNVMKKGIDVSEHNGTLDWSALKPQIDFAMIRAGYGQNNIDKQFVRNISECNRLGIPCGVYWFSYAYTADMARKEAEYCVAAIKPYKISYPVVFDFEYDSVSYANRKGVKVTKTLATSFVTAFCSAIEKAGYYAMNYANADYLSRYFDSSTTERFDLWLAEWTTSVAPSRTFGIWQYSSKGKLNGATCAFDMNYIYKDYESIISGTASAPETAQKLTYKVQIDLTDETEAETLTTELTAKGYKPYITTGVK